MNKNLCPKKIWKISTTAALTHSLLLKVLHINIEKSFNITLHGGKLRHVSGSNANIGNKTNDSI